LCQRSFAHLRAVFEEYAKISKKTVEEAIKSEFSGDIKDGLLTVGKLSDFNFHFNIFLFVSDDLFDIQGGLMKSKPLLNYH